MKQCDYCGHKNSNESQQCRECGSDTFKGQDEPPVNAQAEPLPPFEFAPLTSQDMDKTLVTLMKCRTLFEADMVVTELEGIGISAFIPDQFVMQWAGLNINAFGFVRVQVSPKDYEEAKEFLHQLQTAT